MLSIVKFGGTSIQDTQAYDRASDIILSKEGQVVVILSAMSGITNELIGTLDHLQELTHAKRHESEDHDTSITDMLSIESKGIRYIDELMSNITTRHNQVVDDLIQNEELNSEVKERLSNIFTRLRRILSGSIYIEELTDKTRDLVLSFGERFSCTVMEGVLRAKRMKCQALRSGKVGILTDSVFGNAAPLWEPTSVNLKKTLSPLLTEGVTPIVTGYFGVDQEGNVTTFGRGGSDFSAAIIGSALKAEVVEVYTDVDGFYSADPGQVGESHILRELDYEEAAELAYFGAKVLHPRTIEPLRKKGIPIVIRNTFNPDDPGSKITIASANGQTETGKIRMRAVAAKDGLAIIKITGDIAFQPFFATKVHSVLDEMKLSVFAISTSLASFSFLIEQDKVDGCLANLKEVPNLDFDAFTVYNNVTLICVVGHDIEERIGIAAQIFSVIAENGVNIRMISEGTSNVAVNFVIDQQQKEAAVKAIHNEFCWED
jgi:aspartate kinase